MCQLTSTQYLVGELVPIHEIEHQSLTLAEDDHLHHGSTASANGAKANTSFQPCGGIRPLWLREVLANLYQPGPKSRA